MNVYSAIEETSYLLSSPKNASRLRESIQSYREAKVRKKNWLSRLNEACFSTQPLICTGRMKTILC